MPQGVGSRSSISTSRFPHRKNSLDNVKDALRDGAIMVAVLLFLLLLNLRTTPDFFDLDSVCRWW